MLLWATTFTTRTLLGAPEKMRGFVWKLRIFFAVMCAHVSQCYAGHGDYGGHGCYGGYGGHGSYGRYGRYDLGYGCYGDYGGHGSYGRYGDYALGYDHYAGYGCYGGYDLGYGCYDRYGFQFYLTVRGVSSYINIRVKAEKKLKIFSKKRNENLLFICIYL